MRGDVHELPSPRGARGHEQRGRRFAVLLQADGRPLSTILVAPTSTSARPTSFRPSVEIEGADTLVLLEQTAAIDPSRLGPWRGRLAHRELTEVEKSLRLVLALD